MLVSQPAIRALDVIEVGHGQGGDKQREGRLAFSEDDGLRMGPLYDITQAWAYEHRVS